MVYKLEVQQLYDLPNNSISLEKRKTPRSTLTLFQKVEAPHTIKNQWKQCLQFDAKFIQTLVSRKL